MRITPALYLLRFDDLCPTMDRARWEKFERLLLEFEVKPLLAIVPENRDADLVRDDPDSKFWARMRLWQLRGAAIGLHGYRHMCVNEGRSLLPMYRQTEFAGVAYETQLGWIEAGMSILRGERLEPSIFVAPRHGFDRATLRALHDAKLPSLSDGFGCRPIRHQGITWIPQQLWEPVPQKNGLWTICIHSNWATEAQVAALGEFLRKHRERCIEAREAMKFAERSWSGDSAQTWMTAQFWRRWLRLQRRMKRPALSCGLYADR